MIIKKRYINLLATSSLELSLQNNNEDYIKRLVKIELRIKEKINAYNYSSKNLNAINQFNFENEPVYISSEMLNKKDKKELKKVLKKKK